LALLITIYFVTSIKFIRTSNIASAGAHLLILLKASALIVVVMQGFVRVKNILKAVTSMIRSAETIYTGWNYHHLYQFCTNGGSYSKNDIR